MNRLYLLRRISVIHAVKCNNTLEETQAISSYLCLRKFQESVTIANNGELLNLLEEVNHWANTPPFASENDINQLLN